MFYIVGIRSRLLPEAVQQGREYPKSFLPLSRLGQVLYAIEAPSVYHTKSYQLV